MEFSWTILNVMQFLDLSNYVTRRAASQHHDLEILTNHNYWKLTGRYHDSPDEYAGQAICSVNGSDRKPRQLWRLLTGRNEITDQECSVSIEFPSPGRAKVKLYCCDILIDSMKLNGRIKDNAFFCSRSRIIPFFPIAFGYRKDWVRITLCNKNLIIDCHWRYRLYSLLGVAEGYGEGRGVFKRMV